MDTKTLPEPIASALFGKSRRAVLSLLYGRPDEAFYLREVARVTGVGLGAVQRELGRLARAGIVRRFHRGRHVFFQAEPACPVFAELKGLIVKTSGVGDVVRAALAPLADRISIALLYGSMARAEQDRASDVDLLVVGDVTFGRVVTAIAEAQHRLAREINPTVYTTTEFQAKIAGVHPFLTRVLQGSLVLLIGDERDLARLAGKRLAD